MTASKGPRPHLGLSGKLMLLTSVFVMFTQVLILLPSIASFRTGWLRDRIASARTAALIVEANPGMILSPSVSERLLDKVGAYRIGMKGKGTYRIIAVSEPLPPIDVEEDVRSTDWLEDTLEALKVLVQSKDRTIRVIGHGLTGGDHVELTMPEQPLRHAMLRYASQVLLLSLLVSIGLAAILFAALNRLIITPVKQLSDSFDAFRADRRRIHQPSDRTDEIGNAEVKLRDMQQALGQQFQQQQRLAALGLAVAKINHDLRNMLSSAQLLSDRIASSPDPTVQRLAPKLVGAIDHAISFCQNLLHFGRAAEPPPSTRNVDVASVIAELSDIMALAETENLHFVADIPANTVVRADPNQLLRALMNLARNSIEAMSASGSLAAGSELTISARQQGADVTLRVSDNGPGIPAALRDRLFQPFSATGKSGSTGLGLAITTELLRAQGGDIALEDSQSGTTFRLTLPR